MSTVVRITLDRHGRLSVPTDRLSDQDDLHRAGLDSMAMVNVMLALEEALNIEFPEALMTRESFATIAALAAVLHQLQPALSTPGCQEFAARVGV